MSDLDSTCDINGDQDLSTMTETLLKGYGIRLDIRNIEYNAFEDEARQNFTENTLNKESTFISGVNTAVLFNRFDSTNSGHNKFKLKQKLSTIHSFTSIPTFPPLWKLESLPLQALSVIASSNDPLWKLQDVSQNLPSRVSYLIDIDISEQLRVEFETIQEYFPHGASHLFINNRKIDVSKPTFNIFQFQEILREEYASMSELYDHLDYISSSQIRRHIFDVLRKNLSQLNTSRDDNQKEPMRIDVARGGKSSILYLNNIERDSEFSSWPSSVRSLLYSMQQGKYFNQFLVRI